MFEQDTLDERRRSGGPPERRAMTIETADRDAAVAIAKELRDVGEGGVEVLGPAATPRNPVLVLSRPDCQIGASATAHEAALTHADARVRIVVDPLEVLLPAIGSADKSSHTATAPESQ